MFGCPMWVWIIEHRASELVGYALYFLVAYDVFNSAQGVFIAHRVTKTRKRAGNFGLAS